VKRLGWMTEGPLRGGRTGVPAEKVKPESGDVKGQGTPEGLQNFRERKSRKE